MSNIYNEMREKFLNDIEKNINYEDLITYLLDNFQSILQENNLPPEIERAIFDITDTLLGKISLGELSWNHKQLKFIFKEDNTFKGNFDLDFINKSLANVRAQLFAKGTFAARKLKKKYATVTDIMVNKYGQSLGKIIKYDDAWYDQRNGLVIGFRSVAGFLVTPYISFAITKEQFAQEALPYIRKLKMDSPQ